ncbi:hypothetical protein R1sor_011923 [Riccia sorocarpa]|uniref:Uncharacterized protein n=1 Tax=Riccia sorocarpa TaxID=122646 RepID=A0ABD3I2A4_9MARC
MLASWRIRSEELLGPNSSILEHVAVAGYNKVKTNSKNMEHTFTSHYARVFFANCIVQKWEDDDGLLPSYRCLRLIHSHMRFSARQTCETTDLGACASWHEDGVCVVTTQNKAKEIWEQVARNPASICASQLKSLIIRGKVFKPGDHVIVLDESRNDLTYDWNWKGRIINCFYHSCRGKMQTFCEFRWLYNKTKSGQQTVDPISGMQILHPVERSEAYGNWWPARQLGFHFFPVRRHEDGDILALETEEWRDRGFLFGPSCMGVPPPHPELHDVMLACHADECGSSVLDYCVVRMVFAREDEANASQLPAGTENLLEDIADVTDQTSVEQAGGEVQVQWIRQNGTGLWVMRPGACCSTISFRHLRKLCDNFTVVTYTGDKPCQWIGG